jgi:small subunit ribosomal protein S16
MLAIRLQRLGRTNLAKYRVVVQDSHTHPTSGRIVAYVGSYDPYSKEVTLDADKITFYLDNGAQPSPRVARLLKSNKIKLPSWVKIEKRPKAATRHPEKLRKNQPKASPAPTKEPAAKPVAGAATVQAAAADTPDTKAAEAPAEA